MDFFIFHFPTVLPLPLLFHVAAFKLLYKLVQSARHKKKKSKEISDN